MTVHLLKPRDLHTTKSKLYAKHKKINQNVRESQDGMQTEKMNLDVSQMYDMTLLKGAYLTLEKWHFDGLL